MKTQSLRPQDTRGSSRTRTRTRTRTLWHRVPWHDKRVTHEEPPATFHTEQSIFVSYYLFASSLSCLSSCSGHCSLHVISHWSIPSSLDTRWKSQSWWAATSTTHVLEIPREAMARNRREFRWNSSVIERTLKTWKVTVTVSIILFSMILRSVFPNYVRLVFLNFFPASWGLQPLCRVA